MRKLIIVLLSLIMLSCEGNSQVIKLERNEGDLFITECELNGKVKVRVMLDSGCSTTTIPSYVAMTLYESGTLTNEDFIGYRTYILADGSEVQNAVVKLKSIKIGDRVFEDIEVSINSGKGSALLLGQNVLSQFCKITLDYDKNELSYE